MATRAWERLACSDSTQRLAVQLAREMGDAVMHAISSDAYCGTAHKA